MTASEVTLLFDFDGTLVDSRPAIVESYRHAFRKVLDIEYPTTEEEIRQILAQRFRESAEKVAGDRADDVMLAYREHYLGGKLENPVLVYDGVRELLEGLAERGVRVGLVTNKGRERLEADLVNTGLGDIPFVAIVTAEDTVERKPHPRPVQLGIETVGCDPETTYYVGDGPHDVLAAEGAGARGIAVAYGYWGAERLALECDPHAIVEHPSELLELLDAELNRE